jgi:hypothetical protein
MSKIRYIVLARKLKDGEIIETDGIIQGLTTRIVGRDELYVGGLIRDTTGEIT